MALPLAAETLRQDIIDRLREMAARHDSLDQMMAHVQAELGFSESFVVPVLPFFCKAFELSLRDVLPLREWISDRNDADELALLSKIRDFTRRLERPQ